MMERYELPTQQEPRKGFWRAHWRWLVPLLVFDIFFLIWWFRPEQEPTPKTVVIEEPQPPEPQGIRLSFPTPHEAKLDTDPGALFMPTASGRIESALYGSVRTVKSGSRFLPSFHEGVDFAPVERDRKQRPLDPITAAADGRVLYVNPVAGRSNYGKYIVLGHDDPLGEIYTLYAHLAEIDASIRTGNAVRSGDVLGIMGHTDSTGMPVQRAHLHFEIGVINNARFYSWYKKQKKKPDHGTYHGYNTSGIDPLEAFAWQEEHGLFNMEAYLKALKPAFSIAHRTARPLDYFSRYPSLWSGALPTNGVAVYDVSEGGIILSGRAATGEEADGIGREEARVLSVNEDVLQRNGLRLVVKRNGRWVLGRMGQRWLEILAYQ